MWPLPLCGLFVASLWPLWEEGKKKSEREEAQADRWSKVFATHTMARPTRYLVATHFLWSLGPNLVAPNCHCFCLAKSCDNGEIWRRGCLKSKIQMLEGAGK